MSNSDSKLVQGLLKAFHIIEFGVICIVCCIPIVTAGAAISAMYRMFFRMRQDMPVGFKAYFDEFGNLFKNAFIIELIQIASGIFIALMIAITVKGSSVSSAGIILLVPVSLLLLIWILVFSYVYAYEAYFSEGVYKTFKNCFTMTFGCLLCTTALLILLLILPMIYFLVPEMFIVLIPVWVVLLIPLINWWDSYFYIKAFEDFDGDSGTGGMRPAEFAAAPDAAAPDSASSDSAATETENADTAADAPEEK